MTKKKQQILFYDWLVEKFGGEEEVVKQFIVSKIEDDDLTLVELVELVEKHGLSTHMESIPLKGILSQPTAKLTSKGYHAAHSVLAMDATGALPPLSQREAEILYILQTHGEGITRQRLAQLTNTTAAANNGAIRNLEGLGYLIQRRSSESWYYLTHHGKLRVATAPPPLDEHTEE